MRPVYASIYVATKWYGAFPRFKWRPPSVSRTGLVFTRGATFLVWGPMKVAVVWKGSKHGA